MKTKQITIDIPEGKKAEWINRVLTLVDEQPTKPKDVTERIKTFEDALNELGKEHPLVDEYLTITSNPHLADLVAYLKLRIITAALNEGWEPQFRTDEYRYYPWFYLYTQEELDNDSNLRSRAVVRHINGAFCGFSSAGADGVASYSGTLLGSRLCFKTRKLAIYAGEQFKELYADFYFRPAANQ